MGFVHPKLAARDDHISFLPSKRIGYGVNDKDIVQAYLASCIEGIFHLQKRQTSTTKKHETNRQEESNPITQGPQGTTGWEKTVNMIDFGFNRPNGTDLARYKSILFTAKAKNMPIGNKPGASVISPLA